MAEKKRHVQKRHIIVIDFSLKAQQSQSLLIMYARCISALALNMTTRLTFYQLLSTLCFMVMIRESFFEGIRTWFIEDKK